MPHASPTRRPAATPTLTLRTVRIGTVERRFWLARAPDPSARWIIAFHGLGMTGPNMARFTGLDRRGPDAGFTVAFPDGWRRIWDGEGRLAGRPGVDDAAFVAALVDAAGERPPVLAGISNGAMFVEHLARHGRVRTGGIALVAGSATASSRDAAPVPRLALPVLWIHGTGDRLVPYAGGPLGGRRLVGWLVARQARRAGEAAGRRYSVAVEEAVADWVRANGITPDVPQVTVTGAVPGRGPVTRLCWRSPGHPSVELVRIAGGGHGWPGGPQYLPAAMVGPIPRDVDATGLVLDLARDAAADC